MRRPYIPRRSGLPLVRPSVCASAGPGFVRPAARPARQQQFALAVAMLDGKVLSFRRRPHAPSPIGLAAPAGPILPVPPNALPSTPPLAAAIIGVAPSVRPAAAPEAQPTRLPAEVVRPRLSAAWLLLVLRRLFVRLPNSSCTSPYWLLMANTKFAVTPLLFPCRDGVQFYDLLIGVPAAVVLIYRPDAAPLVQRGEP